jgi:hypothetical protein
MTGATDDSEGGRDFSDFMASAEFLSSRDGSAAALPSRPRPHHSPVYGGARLAAEADLRAYLTRPDDEPRPFAFEEVSLLPADEAGRYTPRYRRPLYLPAAARRQHLLVVSKSGGGKSSRYLEPAAFADLADPEASLLLIDAKGGLAGKLAAAMRTLRPGERPVVVNLADPRRTTHALNLAGGGPLEDVFEDCLAFCAAAEERPGPGDSPFWTQTAARWLTAVLLCLRDEYGRASLADAHHALEGSRDRLLSLLDRHPAARFAAGMASFVRSGSQNADTALATLCGYLRHFVSDALAATTSADEFRLGRLFRRPTVLVLEFDQADGDRLRPFLNLLITRLLRAANREAARRPGGRLPRPLCLYLDDLAALGRLPGLETQLNTLRSRDVRVTAAVQSLAQLDHWYGPASGEVLAGFGTKVFQPPLEQADAEWASRHAGMMTATDTSSVSDKSRRRGRAVPRPLLTPDEVRLSPGHWFYGSRAATVFLPDAPPVQAWFRPAYDLPAYARLSAEALARPRARRLRRRSPLQYRPPGADPAGPVERSLPAGVTNTYGWSDAKIQERLDEVKRVIGLAAADRAARHWWDRHERENHGRLGVVLRLAEELKLRGATVAEFVQARSAAGTDSVEAALAFLDYTRLKAEHDRRAGRTSAERRPA